MLIYKVYVYENKIISGMPKEIYIGTLSKKVIIFEEIVIVEKKLSVFLLWNEKHKFKFSFTKKTRKCGDLGRAYVI